jgi:UPF0271 protein
MEHHMGRLGINCDCGESYGRLAVGNDEGVMPYITSANIACGFHGGDPSTIRRTARLARQHGVSCGAHPSLPDLMGFGRREMRVDPGELTDLVIYQLGAVRQTMAVEGVGCGRVKPHGVLYSMLHREDLASAFADAILAVDPAMAWICEENSPTYEVARRRGIRVITEFTADRRYNKDGQLVITRLPEPVDPELAVSQVRQVLAEGAVTADDGVTRVPIRGEVVCVHSDTPNSSEVVRAIAGFLRQAV